MTFYNLNLSWQNKQKTSDILKGLYDIAKKNNILCIWCIAMCCKKARLDRPNDGSRSASEGLCVLQSFLFTTQQEH